MKFRHLLTGAIIIASLFAATALTSFAAVSKGRFETADDTAISGWAYNNSMPDTPLNVMITIKNKQTGEEVFSQRVLANEYKEHLYKENKGNGYHGFTIQINWTDYPQGHYLIEGSVGNRKFSNTRTYTNGDPEAAEQAQSNNSNLIPLGVFKTTGYCPCRSCSSSWGRRTSTGTIATAGRTIAVDPKVIPYGSKVMINGAVYTAEDRGGAVRGNHIDIFYESHGVARQHGVRSAEVFLVQ